MSWLSDIWDWICSLFSSSPPSNPVGKCPLNGISMQRAQELFDQLKARKDIPFNYPNDCCYARASEMCDTLAKEGIPSGKVWSYGDLRPTRPDGTPVTFPPPPASNGQPVTWGYHVAPVVDVVQPDGSCVPMVMDPSLSDHPLTVSQWNDIMRGPGSRIDQTSITDSTPFWRESNGTPHYEDAKWDRNKAFTSHVVKRDAALGSGGGTP